LLKNYFEKELPKIQEGFKQEQNERDENDNNNLLRLNEESQKISSLITSEKKNREETQEGILEMIKIMNDRMVILLLVKECANAKSVCAN
jgi:hypothetical protein